MSFMLRVSLCLLVLSLSFFRPALAQPPPASSTTESRHSSDEVALRTLSEAFFQTWASKDLDAFSRLWSSRSSGLESRRKEAQEALAAGERIEVRSLIIRAVKMDGGQSRVRVEIDVRVIEAQSGKEKAGYGKTLRTLECVKEAGHWKVRREISTYDEIATALSTAGSELRRAALLAEERELVTAELASALIFQGHRFLNRANLSQAQAIYRLSLNIAEQIGDLQGIALAQNCIGTALCGLGDDTQGFEYLEKSLASYEALGDTNQVSGRLNKIGILHYERGNYARALQYLQMGLALDEALPNKKGIADKLNHIGLVYQSQGRMDQALAYLRKSLKIFEDLDIKLEIAILQNNIGAVYESQGLYEQALEWFQKSLRRFEELKEKGGVAMSLNNIGYAYLLQRRYDEASEYLQKSLRLREEDINRLGLSRTLINLGRLYQDQGKYAEMLEVSHRAAILAEKINSRDELWRAQMLIGRALRAQGHFMEARRSSLAAIATIESLRHDVAGGGQQQQSFLENKLSPWLDMIALLISQKEYAEALNFAERSKARALLDTLQAGRVSLLGSLSPQERQSEEGQRLRLVSLNSELTSELRRDKPNASRVAELKTSVENARLEFEAIETGLYVAHPELKVNRGEASTINAEEMDALLPDATSALLEYVVTDDATYLFVVAKPRRSTASETKVFTIPIKRTELAEKIESFRRRLAERNLGIRAPAHQLYDLLLKPARALLGGRSSLVIAPDDRLWELPFQALIDERDRYLIERSSVSYAPSLTVLREMRARSDRRRAGAAPSTLLALGNPLIGQETVERARLSLRDEKLYPLPEAEAEVRALRQLYGARRSKVYVGAAAREDRLKAEAGQARILHFATHGVLNNAAPLYSYLALAQGDKNEDGLLEAWELMQLDLKADLAVLSACETARGRTSAGEGVIGLTWALFVAGTPATVVSQWEVESASTRDLMLGFHRRLQAPRAADKLTKAESLRRAALRLMKNPETNHPFYWAGFVLVGDGR